MREKSWERARATWSHSWCFVIVARVLGYTREKLWRACSKPTWQDKIEMSNNVDLSRECGAKISIKQQINNHEFIMTNEIFIAKSHNNRLRHDRFNSIFIVKSGSFTFVLSLPDLTQINISCVHCSLTMAGEKMNAYRKLERVANRKEKRNLQTSKTFYLPHAFIK